MGIIEFFTSDVTLDIIFKLLLSVFLSLIIGIERELINKPAGIKTHMLICISATLVMSLGMYLFSLYPDRLDPSRLPAQILAGIGFVGAGTIIRDGFSVKGITTAASLLAITCIGLTIGAGFYEGAILTTIVVFLILSITSPLQNLIHSNKKITLFTITTLSNQEMIGKINALFTSKNIEVLNIKQIHEQTSQYSLLKFLVRLNKTSEKETLIHEICTLENIKEVYVSKKLYEHDVET